MTREYYAQKHLMELVQFLGHHYWVIRVSEEYAEQGCWAEVTVEDYNEATVKLSAKFWAAPPEEKNQILLHELLHLSFTRTHSHLLDTIDSLTEWLSNSDKKRAKAQMDIHKQAAEREEEIEVNRLAILLSRFAPKWLID